MKVPRSVSTISMDMAQSPTGEAENNQFVRTLYRERPQQGLIEQTEDARIRADR